MVTSLFVRKIILPFDGIESLMLFSDTKIVLLPDSAQVDTFKYSKDPVWQRAYHERIEPHLDLYREVLKKSMKSITI